MHGRYVKNKRVSGFTMPSLAEQQREWSKERGGPFLRFRDHDSPYRAGIIRVGSHAGHPESDSVFWQVVDTSPKNTGVYRASLSYSVVEDGWDHTFRDEFTSVADAVRFAVREAEKAARAMAESAAKHGGYAVGWEVRKNTNVGSEMDVDPLGYSK